MNLSNELVFENLRLIDAKGNMGLDKQKFRNLKGSVIKDNSVLVNYLLAKDFIERGEQEHFFYLTDIGYQVIEAGFWRDDELVANFDSGSGRELKYSSSSENSEDDSTKNDYAYFFTPRVRIAIVSGIIALWTFFQNADFSSWKGAEIEDIQILNDSLEQSEAVYPTAPNINNDN